jgi:hypothetical protein
LRDDLTAREIKTKQDIWVKKRKAGKQINDEAFSSCEREL